MEADGTGLSVGIGKLPDRDGHVTLGMHVAWITQAMRVRYVLSKASFTLVFGA